MMPSPNHHDLAHLKIPLENIVSATNNFAKEDVYCTSGFGNYYEGQLLWSGELINIHARRLNKERDDEIERQFWTEISTLSSLQHKNLVSFVGFCDENGEKIIITKDDSYASLDKFLSRPRLTWVSRLEICMGVAHALRYIHYDELRDFSVIHQNIESGTVLLNANREPALSEFRLSMKIKASQRHLSFDTSNISYRLGYTDPTCLETKSLSHKSDMYSFGVLLFELLCGRKAVIDDDQDNYLAPLAVTHYREKKLNEIIDWDLWKQIDSRSLEVFSKTAYECLYEEQSQRPNIDEIVARLEEALELQLKHPKGIISKEFSQLKVPLENILSATNNFAEENVIVESSFEQRYKGQLLWSGELIDITARRLKKPNDEQLFWAEISTLSNLKHKNLVSLIGFCDENDEKIIIVKLEIKGSLSRHLSSPMLTWVRRLDICVGIAHALSFIHYHETHDFSVIHRNITSGTILLNDDLEPKLSNFECSMMIKASQRDHSFPNNVIWCVHGYGDPTYIETHRVSHKSDVYSFAVVMLELLSGRKSIIDDQDNKYLVPVAIFHFKMKILDEIIDPILWKQMDPQSLNIFAELVYDCLNEERSQRPNIDEIITRLEKALEVQLERENAEHSIAVAEVQGMSSNHEKGSVTYVSTSVESHVSKKSILFKDHSHLRLSYEDIRAATNNFAHENVIKTSKVRAIGKGRLLHSEEFIDVIVKVDYLSFQKDEGKKFRTEISMLSNLKHKNLVSIIGFVNCEK